MTNSAICSVLVLLVSAGTVRAQSVDDETAEAGVATYVDELDTVIVSPFVRAGATVGAGVELKLQWNADVISSASVDVITAATDLMKETRHEVGATVMRTKWLAGADLRAGYAYSFENDGSSHILSMGAKRGFAEDNYEVSLGYAVTLNRVGVVDELPATWRSLTVHSLDVGVTRLLNPRTLVEVVYSMYLADGYQASPYRRVPIEIGDDLRGAIWVDELVPDKRWRNAVTARARRAFGDRWFGTLEYRFYADDWGISGHTQRATLAMELSRSLTLRVHQRASLQSGASFYQQHYRMQTRYRTRDRRLSPHLSGMVGTGLHWARSTALGEARIRLGYDALGWRFAEFFAPKLSITSEAGTQPLGWVLGHVVQVGLELRR